MVETAANFDVLKKVYVDPIQDLVAKTSVLRNNIAFDSKNKTGESYNGALLVRTPQAFTYASAELATTAFAVNGGGSANVRKTVVPIPAVGLSDSVSYGLMAAATTSEATFDRHLAELLTAMVQSFDQEYELMSLYGGTSIGTANAVTNIDTTSGTFQISKATWSPHIFGPKEGAWFDTYSDAALTTKLNKDGPAVSSSVDTDNRKLNLTFASVADYNAAAAAAATAMYIVQYGGAGNIGDGLVTTITKSAAGSTVYGIDTSQYGYTRASSVSNSGNPMTFARLAERVANSAGKGGMGDLDAIVNLYSWTDMMNDQAGNRRYVDDNGGDFENGADKLTYYGPNGGKLNIMCDPMLKASEALIVDFGDWKFVGASQPTFNIEGSLSNSNRFAFELPGNFGWGFRRWSQSLPYCRRLARQTLITSIVNVSGPSGGGT